MVAYEGIRDLNLGKIIEKKLLMPFEVARRLILSFKVMRIHKSIIEVLYHDFQGLPASFTTNCSDFCTFFLTLQFVPGLFLSLSSFILFSSAISFSFLCIISFSSRMSRSFSLISNFRFFSKFKALASDTSCFFFHSLRLLVKSSVLLRSDFNLRDFFLIFFCL